VWRTVIIHSLVPNCQIPEFRNAKFGQDSDDEDWEVWFRNKHYAGMRQQLIHHTLNAWNDCLPDLEPIECDADKEKAMFKYMEIFRPLPSPMQTEFAHQNFYNRFKMELRGDPNLFPAEPNQFSAVVDKVMVGTTAEMRRLADEVMKVGYISSVISVNEKRLPDNTKKRTLVRSWLIRVRLVHSCAARQSKPNRGDARTLCRSITILHHVCERVSTKNEFQERIGSLLDFEQLLPRQNNYCFQVPYTSNPNPIWDEIRVNSRNSHRLNMQRLQNMPAIPFYNTTN